MKKIFSLLIAFLPLLMAIQAKAQLDVSKHIPGVKYEKSYSFDICTEIDIDFYTKKGALQMTIPYWIFYKPDFQQICVKHQRGNTVYQTLFDLPNNNCLILLGDEDQIMGSTSVMKDNTGRALKKLNLTATSENKQVAGFNCTKYTFDAPEFSGEMWITKELNDLPNDVGVLKASKMGKYYQELSADGFVLEITSITPKGKKTVMKTKAVKQSKKSFVKIPDDFGVAVNKIDYYEY